MCVTNDQTIQDIPLGPLDQPVWFRGFGVILLGIVITSSRAWSSLGSHEVSSFSFSTRIRHSVFKLGSAKWTNSKPTSALNSPKSIKSTLWLLKAQERGKFCSGYMKNCSWRIAMPLLPLSCSDVYLMCLRHYSASSITSALFLFVLLKGILLVSCSMGQFSRHLQYCFLIDTYTVSCF